MKISQTVFNLQSGHEYIVEMAIFHVQRATTPELGNPEFWFMRSASRLMVLYICVKFRVKISMVLELWSEQECQGRLRTE